MFDVIKKWVIKKMIIKAIKDTVSVSQSKRERYVGKSLTTMKHIHNLKNVSLDVPLPQDEYRFVAYFDIDTKKYCIAVMDKIIFDGDTNCTQFDKLLGIQTILKDYYDAEHVIKAFTKYLLDDGIEDYINKYWNEIYTEIKGHVFGIKVTDGKEEITIKNPNVR